MIFWGRYCSKVAENSNSQPSYGIMVIGTTLKCDDIFGHLKRNELEQTIPSFITALIKAGRKPLLEDVDIYSV